MNKTIMVSNEILSIPPHNTKYIGYIDTDTYTGTHSISVKDFRIYRGVFTATQVNGL